MTRPSTNRSAMTCEDYTGEPPTTANGHNTLSDESGRIGAAGGGVADRGTQPGRTASQLAVRVREEAAGNPGEAEETAGDIALPGGPAFSACPRP